MKKHKSTYGEYTIGEFIQALKKTVEETPYLNLNSPMLISDYNMTGFKYKFDILPTFSQEHRTAGLCLFHSLKQEKEAYIEPSYDTESGEDFFEEEEKEDSSVMKFAKWLKE